MYQLQRLYRQNAGLPAPLGTAWIALPKYGSQTCVELVKSPAASGLVPAHTNTTYAKHPSNERLSCRPKKNFIASTNDSRMPAS